MADTYEDLIRSSISKKNELNKFNNLKNDEKENSEDEKNEEFVSEIYHWHRNLSESLPKLRSSQIPNFNMSLSMRIRNYINREKKYNRQPIYDLHGPKLKPKNPGPISGMPLGGIGCGSISRTIEGEFWQMNIHPSSFNYKEVIANQFSVRVSRADTFENGIHTQVLSTKNLNDDKSTSMLKSWNWGLDPSKVNIDALYPRCWLTYNEPVPGVKLICRQISPFIPNNYRASSLPVCIFDWTVINTGDDICDVSLMFSFQNGDGTIERDYQGGYEHQIIEWEGMQDIQKKKKIEIIKEKDNNKIDDDDHDNNNNKNYLDESIYPENDIEEEEEEKKIEIIDIVERNYIKMKGIQMNHKYGNRPYSKGTFSISSIEKKKLGEAKMKSNEKLPNKYSKKQQRMDHFGDSISCIPSFICDHDGNHGDDGYSALSLWNQFQNDGKLENDYFGYIPEDDNLFYPQSQNSYYSLRAALMETQRTNIALEREKRRKAMELEDQNDYEQYKESKIDMNK